MGILNEMFGDGDSGQLSAPEGELLAEGEYESNAEEILKGYKVYQKKYVFRSLIWKILLVLLAMTSSVMMIMTSEDPVMPAMCLMISIAVGIWFISTPVSNRKKLMRGLDSMEGTLYKAEFFTDKIKISTCVDDNVENENIPEESEQTEQTEQSEADMALDGEKEEIPATVIHLDSPIVDLIDKEDMFILVVKKSYVFIIPKKAFGSEECQKVREKLSVIMGIRYKL
ncbi:MAG: YcxB family protein [Oscillospiraceae bacterium]|nr:YcxB family protein [Oscillospiraceae bacterium]